MHIYIASNSKKALFVFAISRVKPVIILNLSLMCQVSILLSEEMDHLISRSRSIFIALSSYLEIFHH